MFDLISDVDGDRVAFTYPAAFAVVFAVAALGFLFAGFFLPAAHERGSAWKKAGAVFAAVMALAGAVSVYTFRIQLDREGIRVREYAVRSQSIEWDRVERVEYSHTTHRSRRRKVHHEYFYVEGDGRRIRLVVHDLQEDGFNDLLGRFVAWAPASALGGDADAFATKASKREVTK